MKTRFRGPLVAQTSVGRLAQPCGAGLTPELKSPANVAVQRRSSPGVVAPDSGCHAGGRGFNKDASLVPAHFVACSDGRVATSCFGALEPTGNPRGVRLPPATLGRGLGRSSGPPLNERIEEITLAALDELASLMRSDRNLQRAGSPSGCSIRDGRSGRESGRRGLVFNVRWH
jgi:hypothetical protein